MPVFLNLTVQCDTCQATSQGVASINSLSDWDVRYEDGWNVEQRSVPESNSTNVTQTFVTCPACLKEGIRA